MNPALAAPSLIRTDSRPQRGFFPAALAFILLTTPIALTAILVPRIGDVLRDYGIVLPAIGRRLISAGQFLSTTAGIAVAAVLVLLVIAPLCALAERHRQAALALFGLASLACALYLAALALGLIFPMLQAEALINNAGSAQSP